LDVFFIAEIVLFDTGTVKMTFFTCVLSYMFLPFFVQITQHSTISIAKSSVAEPEPELELLFVVYHSDLIHGSVDDI
jgi:hypothetical protein